jgi:hypothetical protein
MKKTIILLLLFSNSFLLNAQNYETIYSKAVNSTNCGKETFSFDFRNEILVKTDKYYNSQEKVPSKIESTGFNNSGYFYEHWNYGFYLDKYGITDYNQVIKKSYRLVFDGKGGELLYIWESYPNNNTDNDKLYFTQKGFEIFCK